MQVTITRTIQIPDEIESIKELLRAAYTSLV